MTLYRLRGASARELKGCPLPKGVVTAVVKNLRCGRWLYSAYPGLGRFFLQVWFVKKRPQFVPKISKETEALKRRTIFTFKSLSVQWFFYVTKVGDGLEEMRELWMEMCKIRVWNFVVTLF